MDKIELVVTHQSGGPVDRHWSAIFGMAGGTVGRAGQNKLVLPDDDAMVARVHAMVRLDSDQAYIANLCERRSVQVDGLEVLSGQEVPLLPGAHIGIGPYQLRAVLPGQQVQAQAQAASRAAPAVAPAAAPAPAPAPMAPTPTDAQWPAAPAQPSTSVANKSLDLASLPNPWADIAPIVGGDPYMPDLVLACLPDAPPPSSAASAAADSNPFAMLGRVEAPQVSPAPSAEPVVTAPAPVAPVPAQPVFQSAVEPVLPNPFDKQPAASKPLPAQPVAHRAMVIPDDFDPFAADPKEIDNRRDPWSGDLVAQSLSEVAQLKNDDLLQSLPESGQFAGEMDNAAHTGLPERLDPTIELNPLKLFREPGESMFVESQDHGMSRGSDLAQVFSMPRDAQHRQAKPIPDAAPAAPTPAEPVVQAGLHAMQGLDLALFGGGSLDTLPPATDLLGVDDALQAPSGAPGTQHAKHAAATQATPATVHGGAHTDLPGLGAAAPLPLPLPLPESALNPESLLNPVSPLPVMPLPQPIPLPLPVAQAPTLADVHVAAQPPAQPAAALAAAAPAAAAPQPTPGTPADFSLDALAAAFLEGAAIEPGKVNVNLTPDFMRGFGEALRVAVQGSIDLLSARSEIKREFRADVTIIASGANNPLKFLPTADGVMLQLAGQTFPGFMKPVPAMQEAYKDLAVHQIALMAGIRAAYAEAVARMSPAELEKNAAAASGLLSKISSVHRKAALWDDFQQRYDAIRRNAEDDLMAFSGQTFVDAYEAAAQAAGENL
ncbi:type VI secretion system-associated FHA domain protein TagH [Acidovorax sp. LjRoot117]|uniref:type VI secretion system-associated FHA domain protein TagH n=1 Tax=Acidovorax sp. LjRoot117 TaxID=3342255 RepID=UPI003ECC6820